MKITWHNGHGVGYANGIIKNQRISFFVHYSYAEGAWTFTAAIRGIEIHGQHAYSGLDQAKRACQRLANNIKAKGKIE